MFLLLLLLRETEARVFCEDLNATPWVPIGFTCPVLCSSIRNAIERLIMLDYNKSLQEQLSSKKAFKDDVFKENIIYHNSIHSLRQNSIHDNESKHVNKEKSQNHRTSEANDTTKEFNDIYITLQNAKDTLHPINKVDKEYSENTNNYKQANAVKKCWYLDKFKPNILIGRIVRKECSRRSNFDGKFLSIMTSVLNEYADTMFKFTDEMTEILLESIFGQTTDLRNNIFDINKLLKYLRKSINLHKSHTNVITLKSRHCLTISTPGCYCRAGYVESSGQCVKPSDCVEDAYYNKYLKRIIVV